MNRFAAVRIAMTAFALVVSAVLFSAPGRASDRSILVQSTTSTQNSGLYATLLPLFEAKTGIRVDVVAVGTGQAIRNARNCDGDVLIVHAKSAEDAFVAEGHGLERHDLMHNDFVIVGPRDDPAGLGAARGAMEALRTLAEGGVPFVSRGDDSGTHRKEMALWEATGIDPGPASGTWYREAGAGMGATLNIAVGMNAYAMTDRATWTTHRNKAGHAILVEGDPALFNQYGVIQVSPERCPNVHSEDAATFVEWLISPEGQAAIGDYRLDGERLFTPNAAKGETSG